MIWQPRLERFPQLNSARVIECFQLYLDHEGNRVSRAEFEANMARKMKDREFHGDIEPLLLPAAFQGDAFDRAGFQTAELPYNPVAAYRRIHDALIEQLSGEPWKGPAVT